MVAGAAGVGLVVLHQWLWLPWPLLWSSNSGVSPTSSSTTQEPPQPPEISRLSAWCLSNFKSCVVSLHSGDAAGTPGWLGVGTGILCWCWCWWMCGCVLLESLSKSGLLLFYTTSAVAVVGTGTLDDWCAEDSSCWCCWCWLLSKELLGDERWENDYHNDQHCQWGWFFCSLFPPFTWRFLEGSNWGGGSSLLVVLDQHHYSSSSSTSSTRSSTGCAHVIRNHQTDEVMVDADIAICFLLLVPMLWFFFPAPWSNNMEHCHCW